MFCKECGKELRETARYCRYCGRQTHRGYVVQEVKKFCKKAGIVLGGILIFLFVLKQMGVIDNIQNTMAENKLCKELTAQAEETIENYEGNTISISSDDIAGNIIFYDDEIYILDANDENNTYMFYSKGNKLYRSINNEKFENIKADVPKYDVFINLLNAIVKDMEISSYDNDITIFTGTYNKEKDIEEVYNVFQSIFDKDIDSVKLEDTEFVLYVSSNDIQIEFSLPESTYTITYQNDNDINPVQTIKNTIMDNAVKFSEGTYYIPEKDQELIIYNDNLSINDDYQLQVTVYMNDEKKVINYDKVIVNEAGISIDGVTYAHGSREEYEEEQEMIQYAEEQHQEKMVYLNKFITVGEEQKLFEGEEFTFKTSGWHSEWKTNYSLADHNDVLMISEFVPTLEKDENGAYSYEYYCKGYYIFNGETIDFEGKIDFVSQKYAVIDVITDKYLTYYQIGVSHYRAVVAKRDLSNYFGSDIDVLCDDGTAYRNYYED